MLVFCERFSLGDFIGPGMGRWLMCMRRVLLLMGRNFIYGFGSRLPVMGVLTFMMLMIFVGLGFGFIMCVVVTVTMDDASLKTETHQSNEQYENPCRIRTLRKITGMDRAITGTHHYFLLKVTDLF